MKKLEIQLKCQAGAPRLQSQLTSRMKKLEIQLKCQAGAPVPSVQPSSRVFPVEIVVTGMKELRQHRDEWTFEPFYSKSGYKMVLGVHPCGQQGGFGTHLSVYIYIVKGDQDQQLKWPFVGELAITLVDQRLAQENHQTYTVEFTCDDIIQGARRFNDTLNNGLGYDELKCLPPNYLKHDCLVFHIDNIK
ncbi:TNF receptor-associated factor 5-like [Halichondria panicea]|uniref:TNF receptor-associated factor 5-like n=1 Tax=Halichondria panicea TaxID=6063 RepID=UPI00312B93D7